MDEENTLFPVEESPEFIDDGDQLDRDYHYTVAWDVEKQDFADIFQCQPSCLDSEIK